jgi:uncharacterized protein with PIN domain
MSIIAIIREERNAKRKKKGVINAKDVMVVAAIKRRMNMVNTRAKSSKSKFLKYSTSTV